MILVQNLILITKEVIEEIEAIVVTQGKCIFKNMILVDHIQEIKAAATKKNRRSESSGYARSRSHSRSNSNNKEKSENENNM